jgi:hypothetical protein
MSTARSLVLLAAALAVVGLLIALPAAAQSTAAAPPAVKGRTPDPDKLPAIRVQDLHYGDVLFHFYADEDFEALTRLEAYSQWQRMPHHSSDAELLAGGLYLSLGMHNEAARRFGLLLAMKVPEHVRNRAWFYLAKIWYERGYFDRSVEALERIAGRLTPDIEAEREHLLVNDLMRLQRYDEAIAQLKSWQGAPDWMAYARFNLGVALVREQRLAEADPILTAVGTLSTDSSELLALRDKANVALGFAYLQAEKPAEARAALNRVRLQGPYSTRALLGAGWAELAEGHYREALTPWLELHGRNLLDAAVQESYLAVPYAFSKLNADAQAADYYETALQSFGSESQRLDAAIANVRGGHMLDELLGDDKNARFGWSWQLKALPDAPQSRYLYSVLADNDFQEGLKNYRDLGYMQSTLGRWDDSMDAFAAMIDSRKHAYDERLPRADALLAGNQPAKLRAARAAVAARLSAIETGDDVAALASPAERDQWLRIERLEADLRSAGSNPELDMAREKAQLLKGVLYWKLDASFKLRSYEEQRGLRELDAALNEAENRWVRVQRARAAAPTNTAEFAARIAALGERIQQLHGRLDQARTQQNAYLEDLAAGALQAQKDRLAAYAVQARFALADIYDRAADAGKANEPEAAPATAAPPAASAPAAPAAAAPAEPATAVPAPPQ